MMGMPGYTVEAIRITSEDAVKSPIRGPLALSPDITIRGSPKSSPRSPREEYRRPRSASSTTGTSRHRSPPRTPYETKALFDPTLHRIGHDTLTLTQNIIQRSTEIRDYEHDIAIWEKKIHAAKKLVSGLRDQVDVLVKSARDKQDIEKELVSQRDSLLRGNMLSEKEYNALGMILGEIDLNKGMTISS